MAGRYIRFLKERPIRRVLLVGLILAGADALLVAVKWPFTRIQEIEHLEHFAQSNVTIEEFDKKFFPAPGFDAKRIMFVRWAGGNNITLASVEHVECRTTWLNVLTYTHRVSRLNLSGLSVVIPDRIPPAIPLFPNRKERATIERLFADGTSLDVRGKRFTFTRLHLFNIGNRKVITYDVAGRIPVPVSYITSSGTIGPFSAGDKRDLPLSGRFELRDGNLQYFKNLGGNLSGRGTFSGILAQLNVTGTVLLRQFHILRVPNPVDLSAEFRLTADCKRGDVQIREAVVHFAHTDLKSFGSVAQGIVKLDVQSAEARLEDLLGLVVSSPRPPAMGGIHFRSEIRLPPGREEFLRRIQMKGGFEITGGELANPISQHKMDELSGHARSRKDKKKINLKQPPHVKAHVRATYQAEKGQATLSTIVFDVPDANVQANGTFNLVSKAIHFRGTLAMRASLSGAAGGIKSVLLLPLDPFYKKQDAGAVIPVTVRGTARYPIFHVSLRKKGG